MALVESVSIPLGTPMPPFSLSDPSGKRFDSTRLSGQKGLLVAFTCNHCPYAIAVWPRLIAHARDFKTLGVETVAINPNIHPGYPEDAPAAMIGKISEWGIPFPYLVDETQETAKAFKAQCTPDLYLFDAQGTLAYHGRIDDDWQDEKKVSRRELAEAVEALVSGEKITADQKPSMGCSIKWK
ncbi:MAG: thioredoxin family protein [Elusimicrobia bacterium CG_4_9_14_3_um_filter_62_55]|nr:MAG: thioredoxin family protein [Elusimicrobia bacterium CG22_combo_CG10-13_8_21_14_all_63_91]PJA18633.1 MAG: thioredoxin family protein [Elusimicrobia bacterium CG_4_10_14_0_2_um_filter_63_34]PJB23377.1 MAG: thioredoxin family protein [Elusimicrobia bacterium CG_4_9_14_3_um_filter_62_55]